MLDTENVIPKFLPSDQNLIFNLIYPRRRVNNPEMTFVPGVSFADVTRILERSAFHEKQVVQDNLRVLESMVEITTAIITEGGILSSEGDLDIGFRSGNYSGLDNFVNNAIWARYDRVAKVRGIDFAIPEVFVKKDCTDVFAPYLADRLRVHDGGYGGVYAVSRTGSATWLHTGNFHTLVNQHYQTVDTVRILRPAQVAAVALDEAVMRYRVDTAQKRYVEAPANINPVIIRSGFISR